MINEAVGRVQKIRYAASRWVLKLAKFIPNPRDGGLYASHVCVSSIAPFDVAYTAPAQCVLNEFGTAMPFAIFVGFTHGYSCP